MIAAFGLSLPFAVALCFHVVRTWQQTFWLWVILAIQPLGRIVYLAVVVARRSAPASFEAPLRRAPQDEDGRAAIPGGRPYPNSVP